MHEPAPRPGLPAAIVDTLSTVEAAKLFGVTPDTVRVYITHGRLRAYNVGTAACPRYRIPRAAILELFVLPDVVAGR